MFRAALLAGLLAALPASAQERPCGKDNPCEIAGGSYHLIFPPGWDGTSALRALVFYHGYRSSGASVFRSGGLKADFVDAGWLVIAPNGAFRPGTEIRAWPARPDAGGRDDVAFSLAVLDDVAERVPLDADNVFAAGFSAGGSMVWMMACYASERFDGFVAISGALRRPVPDGACPSGPVRLLQVHGFADTQVPFEGRAIGDWHQGDLFESFALMRATSNCRSNPDDIEKGARFRCRSWTSCEAGALKMCLHDGGHGLTRGWTGLARDWFDGGG